MAGDILFRHFSVFVHLRSVVFRPFFLALQKLVILKRSDHQNRRAAARLVLVSIANSLRAYLIAISGFILFLLILQVLPRLCFLCGLLILCLDLIFSLHDIHRQCVAITLRRVDRIRYLLSSAHEIILVELPSVKICHRILLTTGTCIWWHVSAGNTFMDAYQLSSKCSVLAIRKRSLLRYAASQ